MGTLSGWPRARFSLHFITEKPPPWSWKVEAHLSAAARARRRAPFSNSEPIEPDRLDVENFTLGSSFFLIWNAIDFLWRFAAHWNYASVLYTVMYRRTPLTLRAYVTLLLAILLVIRSNDDQRWSRLGIFMKERCSWKMSAHAEL